MTIVLAPCQAAIEFDGVNDQINLPADAELDFTTSYSFSAWLKAPLPNASGYHGIWWRGRAENQSDIEIYVQFSSNDLIIAHNRGNAGTFDYVGFSDPPNDTWYHLVVTYTGNTMNAYYNGISQVVVQQTPTGFIDPLATTSNISRFGATGTALGFSPVYFNGQMEDARIYNRALTTSEIQTLYNSRSKRPSGSLANGLVAHYEMDDDAIGEITAQAKDSSGNLNHGQFIGFDNLVSNGFSTDVPVLIGTGNSLEFDGVDDYVEINNHLLSNLSTVSICFMAKPTATNNRIEISEGTDNTIRATYGLAEDGNAYILPASLSGYGYANWSTLGVSNYIHYCGIYDGAQGSNATKAKIYLNGLQKTLFFAGTIPNSVGSFTGNAQIGKRPTGFYSNGKLDDFRIYNKALTVSEISFLYNGSGLDPGTSNLQALWTFDDDSALKDSSGNNNHGVGIGGDSLKYTEGILRR